MSGREMVMSVSGLIIFVISIMAFIGWFTGLNILSSILTSYIPMAPFTALFFLLYGLFMMFNLFEKDNRKLRLYILTIVLIITIYGLLKFLAYFIKSDVTLEQFLFSGNEMLGDIPLKKMSDYAGLLFFITGIAVYLKYFGKEKHTTVNLIGGIGLFVSFAGFVASLGYLFGTPFLYSGKLIPLAFTSAIAFMFLGVGLIALSGDNNYFVSKLNGSIASARILRAFIPFLILENVFGDKLDLFIAHHYNINPAMTSAMVSLVTIIIAIILTLYITKIVFQSANKAEAERIKAEESLKESLNFRNTLLKTIPFEMDIIDENGTILFQNDVLKNKLGREVVGVKCWEVYRDDKTQCFDCPIKKGIKIGATETTESHDVFGGKIFEIIHTGLMFNGKIAMLEIFHNVTERKQSELQVQKYAGELEIVNSTKDKLFNIIAHDLRSPFSSILGLTQLLNEQYEATDEDDRKTIILKLNESSQRAFNLLENLLAWSLAQRKGIKVKPEKIELRRIAANQIDVFDNIAQTKNIQISNLIAPDTFAKADKNMVTAILRNLLNNALKFTRSGGTITLVAIESGNEVMVSITDSGVGIAKEELVNIFNPNDTHTTLGTDKEKGTGLGLIVCKEFVERNRGKIWVESEEGRGSRFTFTLPVTL